MAVPEDLGVLITIQHFLILPNHDLPQRDSWHYWGAFVFRICPLILMNCVTLSDLVVCGAETVGLLTSVTEGVSIMEGIGERFCILYLTVMAVASNRKHLCLLETLRNFRKSLEHYVATQSTSFWMHMLLLSALVAHSILRDIVLVIVTDERRDIVSIFHRIIIVMIVNAKDITLLYTVQLVSKFTALLAELEKGIRTGRIKLNCEVLHFISEVLSIRKRINDTFGGLLFGMMSMYAIYLCSAFYFTLLLFFTELHPIVKYLVIGLWNFARDIWIYSHVIGVGNSFSNMLLKIKRTLNEVNEDGKYPRAILLSKQQVLVRMFVEDTRILMLNSFPIDKTFVTLSFTSLAAIVAVLYQFKQLEEILQT